MMSYLDNQMSEKRHRYDAELQGNRMYMDEWNAKMDAAGKLASEKEQARKEARKAN